MSAAAATRRIQQPCNDSDRAVIQCVAAAERSRKAQVKLVPSGPRVCGHPRSRRILQHVWKRAGSADWRCDGAVHARTTAQVRLRAPLPLGGVPCMRPAAQGACTVASKRVLACKHAQCSDCCSCSLCMLRRAASHRQSTPSSTSRAAQYVSVVLVSAERLDTGLHRPNMSTCSQCTPHHAAGASG